MAEWFNLQNVLYLVLLVMGFVLTVVSAKYRAVVKELTDVVSVYKDAADDGNITADEKQKILKEVFDVLKAILVVVWNPFKFKK